METVIQNVWSKSKLLIKTAIIGVILLLLQIPAFQVQTLIEEREKRQKEAVAEVSSKWAGRQTITGPVLVVPFLLQVSDSTAAVRKEKRLAYFLPDELQVKAEVTPQEKYRGIYKVMLYSSDVRLQGWFSSLQPQKLGLLPEAMLWNEASVRMSLSDYKGLNEELRLKINDSTVALSPQDADDASSTFFSTPVSLSGTEGKDIRFATQFSLNGSEQLLFTPVGRTTTVNLSSAWPHPSFTGNSLPQTTAVTDSGFTATWKTVGHKQGFPQQWRDDPAKDITVTTPAGFQTAAFGADLFVPVNNYQKTMRSIKYSLLCLVLTFAAFFLIEINNQKSAHPFHYGLVGLALILFYTLLLSFSEYIGFNLSYVIASAATIGLIGWFVKDILYSGKLALLLSFILLLLYGYVFTILQLQDYSLLLGSIGLFITLAVIMRFSKKFQW